MGEDMKETVQEVLSEVTGFIDFLRKEGYQASVSCFSPVFTPVLPTLLRYETHLPAYCNYLKSNPDTYFLCVENKRKLNQKQMHGAYYSCCHAGVEEFVYPVERDGARIFCINLSGYRGTLEKSAALKEKIRPLCDEKFSAYYDELSPTPPSLNRVRQALRPLARSVLALYEVCLEASTPTTPKDKLYLETLAYLCDNYTRELTAQSVAESLNYSESYLRHVFREKSGVTLGAYLISLRLSHAKTFLKSGCTVTETAFLCGFSDSNYFSVLFKKKYGVTPNKYKNA